MEKILCDVCKKYQEESEDVPGWCCICADKYGHLNDDKVIHVEKIKRKRDAYE
jgi:hypothetical protein